MPKELKTIYMKKVIKMTAGGELLIDEDLSETASKEIKKEIEKKYGKDIKWRLSGHRYRGIYRTCDLPKNVIGDIIIELRNGEERKVGEIKAFLDFNIEGEGSDKYIVPEIKDWNIEMLEKPERWDL